jgi:hypothetical protein
MGALRTEDPAPSTSKSFPCSHHGNSAEPRASLKAMAQISPAPTFLNGFAWPLGWVGVLHLLLSSRPHKFSM